MCKEFEEFQKPLSYSLSDRHQMLQAYLSASSTGQAVFQVKDISAFYIQDVVRQCGFTESNAKVTVEMLYKGTSYKDSFLLQRTLTL